MSPLRIDVNFLSPQSERLRIEYPPNESESFGYLEYEICNSYSELLPHHKFGEPGLALSEYLEQVGIEEQYPMGFAIDLNIDGERRDKGHDSNLLAMFEAEAAEAGVRLLIGRLGYCETETLTAEEVCIKNLHFYQKNGWLVSEPREDRHAFVIKRLE